ncbi:inheritance of peroxisomes protein 1-domain-containing protein [Xylariaceae sp. FL1272]|nr:inheritance of peroxisomes protein 1-domain-containing protein [Xylariaceae sp. FL1272]
MDRQLSSASSLASDPPSNMSSHAPGFPKPRRVSTAPASTFQPSLQRRSSYSPPSTSEALVETLYNHPCVKIVAFTTATVLPGSPNHIPPGTLSPSSRLERTIAVGPFRIYRAPGSVAFLSCGSALQPILPRSQCWSVAQDNSRFVLQIRRPQYWRLELPISGPDDEQRGVLLRRVFDTILLFEKTECPFQRSFAVTLPNPPSTPVKKKAWTAEGKHLVASAFESDLSPPAQLPKPISRPPPPTIVPRVGNGAVIGNVELLVKQVPHVEAVHDDNALLSSGGIISEQRVGSSLHDDPHADSLPDETAAKSSKTMDAHSVLHTAIERRSDPVLECSARSRTPRPESILTQTTPSPQEKPSHYSHYPGLSEGLPRERSNSQVVAESDYELSATPDLPRAKIEERQAEVEASDANRVVVTTKTVSDTAHANASGLELGKKSGLTSNLVTAELLVTSKNDGIPNIQESLDFQSSMEEPEPTSDENGPAAFEGSGNGAPLNLTRKRMSRMLAGRSFTAPPQLTLVTSPPSKSSRERHLPREPPSSDPSQPYAAGNDSPSTSTASFHTIQSWHSPITPLPPSPPSSRPESPAMDDFMFAQDDFASISSSQSQDDSDCNRTPRAQVSVEKNSISLVESLGSTESTPTRLHSFIDKVPEQINHTPRSSALEERFSFRRRPRPSNLSISHRALSPLPPAANLFTPPPRQTPQSRLATVRRLPVAIVQKTVEILLSPPSHLVNLMLKVASKIVAGEWRGLVFGLGESGEQIPVQWDYFSDGEFSNLSDDDTYLYATANRRLTHNGDATRLDTSRELCLPGSDSDKHGSWELD